MLVKTYLDPSALEPLENAESRSSGTSTPHQIKMTLVDGSENHDRVTENLPNIPNKFRSLYEKKSRNKPKRLSSTATTIKTINCTQCPLDIDKSFNKNKSVISRMPPSNAVGTNRKLTEFFPVRRSIRKCKKTVLEEMQRDLENKVRTGSEEGLEVRDFGRKGRGVVTTRSFLKGEFVVEYIGDLIEQTEAKQRELKYAKDQNTGCYMYYFQHKNTQYCVDATAESNKLGRLVNHSRNGNLLTKIIEIDKLPHLVLIAKEDIHMGSEISYDYGDRSKESIRNHPWLAF